MEKIRRMFTLKGASCSGKSTKIKEIAKWIQENYSAINIDKIDFDSNEDILGILQVNNLKIGFVSAGDNLDCVKGADTLLQKDEDIDIILNCCRSRGETYQYINSNYSYQKGWIGKYIYVNRFNEIQKQRERDKRVIEELKCWLMGLEKI
ncbi:hypothetical protein ACI76Y_04695 [Capnocytophaga cynodegmi]|uniref:hypothetical protein n=1 Tax=Capnocytophaga cynodegmi TaxID=28189 RepID=UPI0038593668